jgi:hypothetical protein
MSATRRVLTIVALCIVSAFIWWGVIVLALAVTR